MKRGLFVLILFTALFSMGYVSALHAVSCIDMDFRNYTVKGTLYSDNVNYTDYCLSYSLLVEYYCASGEENIIAESISCPCNDGRCVSCSDSDYGKVPNQMGEVITDKKESYFDSCFSKGEQHFVKEYYCLNDKPVFEDLPCEGICYAGSCHGSCSEIAETCTGKICGVVNGGCGKNITCGSCSSGQVCSNYECVNPSQVEEVRQAKEAEENTETVQATTKGITGNVISDSSQKSGIIGAVIVTLVTLLIVLKLILRKKPEVKPEIKQSVEVKQVTKRKTVKSKAKTKSKAKKSLKKAKKRK